MGTSADYRFLESRERICQKACAHQHADADQIYTMGDVARCSVGKEKEYHNEELLYKLFGINAELLIDHAWGYEPCTIADIKVYKPEAKSIGSGQVLSSAYSLEKAKIVVLEMVEQIAFDLFEQKLVSKQFVLTIGYDRDNLQGQKYSGIFEFVQINHV